MADPVPGITIKPYLLPGQHFKVSATEQKQRIWELKRRKWLRRKAAKRYAAAGGIVWGEGDNQNRPHQMD